MRKIIEILDNLYTIYEGYEAAKALKFDYAYIITVTLFLVGLFLIFKFLIIIWMQIKRVAHNYLDHLIMKKKRKPENEN
ncbi:MAG TPA: hypothetical protein PLU17_06705 [Chitinophagaceae bacterium]|nr:hypothetical protein [Chitinophagaceae bacterium]